LAPPGINLLQYWLHNPLYGYGIWVPVLAVYLSWKRGWVVETPPERFPRLAAVVVVAYFACLPVARVVQVANADWRFTDWVLSSSAAVALLALVTGWGGLKLLARQWFPIVFLLTAVPWPTSIEHGFTDHALRGCTVVVEELLALGGVAAVASGRALHTTIGPVGLTDDCSGIRSVQLALMASLFWIGFFGLRNLRALVMLGAGLLTAVLFNVMRASVLVYGAASSGRPEVVHEWHDPAGNLAQVALMLALPGIGRLLRGQREPMGAFGPGETVFRGASMRIAGLALAWVVVSEAMVIGWFRLHEHSGAEAGGRWTLQEEASIPNVRSLPVPDVVRADYNYALGRRMVWKERTGAACELIWLDFDRGSMSACMHNIHQPEVCLATSDHALVARFSDITVEIDGHPAVFQHRLFRRDGRLLHLFNAALIESAAARDVRTDWTWSGRFRAARMGIRGQEAALVHLLIEHPYQPKAARSKAGEILGRILKRTMPE
jgi:exosortase